MTTPESSGSKTVLENSAETVKLSSRLRDIWRYRELMVNLTAREIKVKYKNSVLGIVWTFLNPLLYLAVFSLVFGVILPSSAPRYGLLLLAGLQAWNLFAMAMTSSTTSITGNATLVQKVWFPREILPLSAVGASLVTFCFQMIVLLIGLAVFRQAPAWEMLPLLIPAILVALLLGTGLGLLLSAVNVYFRDVQHFLELGVLTWFWFTPIVYQYDFVARAVTDRWGLDSERLTLLNPMIPVVTTFQRVLYNPENFDAQTQSETFGFLMRDGSWFFTNLLIEIVVGIIVLVLGLRVFRRLEANFGEEL